MKAGQRPALADFTATFFSEQLCLQLPSANPDTKFILTIKLKGIWLVITSNIPTTLQEVKLHFSYHTTMDELCSVIWRD